VTEARLCRHRLDRPRSALAGGPLLVRPQPFVLTW
jgi:hypothetical protein